MAASTQQNMVASPMKEDEDRLLAQYQMVRDEVQRSIFVQYEVIRTGALILVFRAGSSVEISLSHFCHWQGGLTQQYWESSEEAQRRQGRKEPGKANEIFRTGH